MRKFLTVVGALALGSVIGAAQNTPSTADELARVSRELRETRSDLQESRRQIEELQRGLEELRGQVKAVPASGNPVPAAVAQSAEASSTEPSSAEPSASTADRDPSFLAAKVAELHQDKVESRHKYPVKLSGLVLFNGYLNKGVLDAEDLPELAFPANSDASGGGVGATLVQTVLGVDVTGPKVFGARTSASAEIDFAGGSPPIEYGAATGLVRLRTANLRLDWAKTSVAIGQDTPFFSPLSPTSYATIEEPAMSWSGNLWVWTPQIVAEHRFSLSDDSAIVVQGGLLDPFTEEIPQFQGRAASAGEETGVPAIAGRVALDRSLAAHHPFSLGFAGYRAKQRYKPFKDVDSWTVNTDLRIPLGNRFALSGEMYRGQAVGGLGGGIWTSVTFPEPDLPHTAVHPLRSMGGWLQLKATPITKLEINGAFGQDENVGRDLVSFPFVGFGFPALKKNRTEFVNLIYKPNSILLFALEYRRIFTAQEGTAGATGSQVNVAAGVRF